MASHDPYTLGLRAVPDLEPKRWIVRYRGFVLMPQSDLSWLVRPERSPMPVLPFRAPASSLEDVKALVDWRLTRAA
ncbi:hypothetical protein KQ304_11550 [Synechococcus sp. CS-1329]|jgi:hypothetical protein|uniref:hypothetical protein n=1 Tax=Synechococcus sp. CS-1329 TaxID=2847975 RepID=UPI00223A8E48|nr:hypothetical protein [Synechococcus sp. CS-1329]MCT0219621.1 hypothetical protein [Synechococcus sp. CS-1329]